MTTSLMSGRRMSSLLPLASSIYSNILNTSLTSSISL